MRRRVSGSAVAAGLVDAAGLLRDRHSYGYEAPITAALMSALLESPALRLRRLRILLAAHLTTETDHGRGRATAKNQGKSGSANAITADLVAVLVAVTDGEPKIMTIANASALPSGPFEFAHRSLQSGLRAWVEAQTGHPLGYVEQLYTFADRGRTGDAQVAAQRSRSAISA